MARSKKAPEFQCHVKYKNELPLPPVSSVLFNASLTLPTQAVLQTLSTSASEYTPTSLEAGTRYFSLPADLLRFSMLNFVDLDAFKKSGGSSGCAEDRDILVPIESVERKAKLAGTDGASQGVGASGAVESQTLAAPSTASTASTAGPVSKRSYARPEVTWLRRTEYISSLRPSGPSTATDPQRDDSRALLSEPVRWDAIRAAIEDSFAHPPAPRHPTNPSATLQQSFSLLGEDRGFFPEGPVHCLFLGDLTGSGDPTTGLLRTLPDAEAAPDTIAAFYIPSPSMGTKTDGLIYNLAATFDMQGTERSARNLVIMLPTGEHDEDAATALLTPIASNFSLKKRRIKGAVTRGSAIKVHRSSQ